MNKKFDDKKDNLVKRDFIEKVSVYEDVEANVKAEVSKGKQIFTLEANLSEEEFISETEKAFRETINSLAKSMGVQPSMFEDKVKERMDELKNLKLSAVIKEKVVFDETTGWLISYDRVMELHSAVTGETFIESRCTISGK
jgi:flagellar basal body P-ring protein FlgI